MSLQDSLQLSTVDILLHFTLKRAPKRIHEDLFGLTRISRDSNSASHILKIRWREVTDGATRGDTRCCHSYSDFRPLSRFVLETIEDVAIVTVENE